MQNYMPSNEFRVADDLIVFPGAVICVTHDRLLIRDWPGRVLKLTPNGLSE